MIDMLPQPIDNSIRELTPPEIASLAPLFAERGAPMPDPSQSVFLGQVEGGEVVCFLVLQIRLHADPMWIKDGHSSKFLSLIQAAEKTILERTGPQWCYVFTPAGRVSQLAQAMGMQLEPWCVHSKYVTPEIPRQTPVDLSPPPMFEEKGVQ